MGSNYFHMGEGEGLVGFKVWSGVSAGHPLGLWQQTHHSETVHSVSELQVPRERTLACWG